MFKIFIWIFIGYLVGSIPWSLVIGMTFFKKDVRNFGSGNLGGTNAGRVLGKPIGLLVIFLDAMKAFIVMSISYKYVPNAIEYIGLAVCFGHCFPLFAGFKGGKAVACSYGYLLGLSIYITKNPLTVLVPGLVFFIVLIISKMVSLSSMISILSSSIYMFFIDKKLFILLFLLSLFVIYRHTANIKRIINHKESKIKLFN